MTVLQYYLKDYDFKSKRDGMCREQFIELGSVGAGLEKTELMVHHMLRNGTYDLENYTELEDCSDEWFDSLSYADSTKIYFHLKNLEV